jgi:ankyrin repeat protein
MVTLLLLAGSDVKLEASGRTPLQLALDFNNAECFTILINHINDAPDLTLDQENRGVYVCRYIHIAVNLISKKS